MSPAAGTFYVFKIDLVEIVLFLDTHNQLFHKITPFIFCIKKALCSQLQNAFSQDCDVRKRGISLENPLLLLPFRVKFYLVLTFSRQPDNIHNTHLPKCCFHLIKDIFYSFPLPVTSLIIVFVFWSYSLRFQDVIILFSTVSITTAPSVE